MGSLINRIIYEIECDIYLGDNTALEELLKLIPRENLINFLPEEDWKKYEKDYLCDCCDEMFIKEEMKFNLNGRDLCLDCSLDER